MREFTTQKDKGYRNERVVELMEHVEGDLMQRELDQFEIIKIISSMPEEVTPEQVTDLMINLLLAYNIQSEWHTVASRINGVLMTLELRDGNHTIH